MSSSWMRVIIAAVVTVVALFVGMSVYGSSIGGGTADATTGLVPGADAFMLVLAISLLFGFIVYAVLEYVQTKRLDSIARQFDTRTIVLIPIAIAINIVLGQTVGTALKIPLYLDSIGTILVGALAGPIPGALTGLLANLIWTFVLAGTPFGSAYAWPYAIVAAEIGLLAGVFGYYGFFRSRPNTGTPRLVGGVVVAGLILFGLVFYGVIPFYAKGFTFFGQDTSKIDPLFLALSYGIAIAAVLLLVVLAIQLFRKRDLGVAYIVVGGAICGVISALISAPISAFVFGGVTGSGADILVAAFQQAGSSLIQAVFQQGLLQDPIDKTIEFIVAFLLLQTLSRRFTARFPQGERAVGVVQA
jgi:energy-coupling factor transport system substrate-specific component